MASLPEEKEAAILYSLRNNPSCPDINALVPGVDHGLSYFMVYCFYGCESIVAFCLNQRQVNILLVDSFGDSCLNAAIRKNELGIVRLLSMHPDFHRLLNLRNNEGDTPLIQACRRDRDGMIVEILVQTGNIWQVNHDGDSALMAAIFSRNTSERVISSLAAHPGFFLLLERTDPHGWTPLMHLIMIATGNFERVLSILAGHPSFPRILNQTDESGMTALMFACHVGEVGYVQILVQAGADLLRVDKFGYSALLYAIIYHEGVLSNLATHSDFSRLLELTDRGGWTALMHACFQGREGDVRFLMQAGANHLYVNQFGMSALTIAIEKNQQNIIRDLITRRTSQGQFAIHAACEVGDANTVQALLEMDIRQLEFRDNQGRTSLSVAASSGKAGAVLVLLENGASYGETDRFGVTPLGAALQNKERHVAQLIFDTFVGQVTEQDDPMALHSILNNLYRVHLPIDRDMGDLLSDMITHPFARALDANGNTPLHVACDLFGTHVDVLRLLVKRNPGALKIANKDGELPLHVLAASQPELMPIQFLMDAYFKAVYMNTLRQKCPVEIAKENGASDAVIFELDGRAGTPRAEWLIQ